MPKFIPVVNRKDEVTSVKEKRACTEDDITRVTGLLVHNSQGEVLLAKRVASKYYDPNKWSHAVNGTVENGETYLSNILKESEEEIGLRVKPSELKEICYGYFETSHKFFYCMYAVRCDWTVDQFRLQSEEVAEVRWVSEGDLEKWIEKQPQDFATSFATIQAKIRGHY